MSLDDDIPPHWGLSSLAALLAIALGTPLLCWAYGAGWLHLLAGAVIWLLSVVLKRVLAPGLRVLPDRTPDAIVAGLQGLLSAATELGAAAIYFMMQPAMTWIDIVGFGVGAGAAEAGYVLLLGIIGPKPPADELRAWIAGAAQSYCVRYSVPIERLFALVGHTGARGLLYLGVGAVAPSIVLAALAAVVFFVVIDGVAVYGHQRRWKWHDPATCRRAHGFFALLSVLEFTLFLAAYPRVA